MPDPKTGAAHLKRDFTKPYFRVIQIWNTAMKPSHHQWLNEDQILALRNDCDRALAEIEADRADAKQLADQILGRDA